MTTEWRPVVGYEGLYEVSSDGRVRSLDRVVQTASGPQRFRGVPLRLSAHRHGYPMASLSSHGKKSVVPVHRLVAEAFLGARPPGSQVRHLNGAPTDNRVENLAWGSVSENMRDQVRHGTHPHAFKTHCPHGHEYDATNTRLYTKRSGSVVRFCRACERARSQARASRSAA